MNLLINKKYLINIIITQDKQTKQYLITFYYTNDKTILRLDKSVDFNKWYQLLINRLSTDQDIIIIPQNDKNTSYEVIK